MSTSLYHSIIFGPVHSRRLGLSLGVNLLPTDNKLCSFDCIYCECGWSAQGFKPRFNKREDVVAQLEAKLKSMAEEGRLPDVITFAGNGEPTMHPDFGVIVDDVIALRDRLSPNSKISVLSNATQLGHEDVRKALLKVDNNILKLDSAFDETVQMIDNPKGNYSVEEVVRQMKSFDGRLIIQTMFLRGEYNGRIIDNTTPGEVEAWLSLVKEIRPSKVMIYTIDRDTPVETLSKVSVDDLKVICDKVKDAGIECSYAG